MFLKKKILLLREKLDWGKRKPVEKERFPPASHGEKGPERSTPLFKESVQEQKTKVYIIERKQAAVSQEALILLRGKKKKKKNKGRGIPRGKRIYSTPPEKKFL